MSMFLDRYWRGERQEVWADLQRYGDGVRSQPLYSDAVSVAFETMTRVRRNIEQLVSRLETIGYQFWYPVSGPSEKATLTVAPPVFLAPTGDVSSQVDQLEQTAGVLPISLRAFFEVVGAVNFIGSHPQWRWDYELDPLFVNSLPIVLGSYEAWKDVPVTDDLVEEEEPAEGLTRAVLPVSPDEFHKYNISGGMWYGITLPNATVDAELEYEWHGTTFVDYLRTSFQWGGLPGLARVSDPPREELRFLTEGLLPI